LNRARNLHERGQTPAAEKLLRSEYEAAKASKDLAHQAWMAFGIGRGSRQLTRLSEAAQFLEEAVTLAEELKSEDLEGMARHQYGLALRHQGRRPKAKLQLELAYTKLLSAQHYDIAAQAMLDLAQMETNFLIRETILRKAVEDAAGSARPGLEARLLLAWAGSQYNEGNAAGAMATYRRTIDRLEQRALRVLRPMLADAWTGLGRVYRLHGDHARAREAYDKALALLEGRATIAARGRVLEMLALSYASTGEREEALRSLTQAIELLRNAGPRVQGKRLASAAVTYLMLGEPEKTIELLQGNPGGQHCQGRWPMSAALYKLKRYDESVRHASQGIQECRAVGVSEPLARALRWRALSLEALGHREKAIEDAMESLRVVERMREHLAPEDLLKRGFDNSYQQLVHEAVGWLHDSKRHAEAIEVAEQGRARAFVDLLASRNADPLPEDEPVRLQGTKTPELRSSASLKAAPLSRMQEAAARLGSSILSFWIGDGAVYSWVVDGRGLRTSVRTPIAYAALEKLVRKAASREGAASRAALRELYRHLIAPVETQLPAGQGRITVIPHGLLFQVPFAAFLDAGGKYLIEKWETHYAPSVASLEAAADAGAAQAYLLAGNPVRAAAPAGAKPLAPLPGSQQEIVRIAALQKGAKPLLLSGREMRLGAVLEAMRQAGVLHFATHAVVDQQRPLESYLALSEGDRLSAREIYSQPLHARLVVLSACRSATGEISADGVLGLTRAFFSAGVTRVIASIWDAADQTSSILAESFHREYLVSRDASAALRKAQLALLGRLRSGKFEVQTVAGPGVLAEHPALWAPFVLQGRP